MQRIVADLVKWLLAGTECSAATHSEQRDALQSQHRTKPKHVEKARCPGAKKVAKPKPKPKREPKPEPTRGPKTKAKPKPKPKAKA